MQDLLLWDYLRGATLPAPALLLPLLDAAARLPLRRRIPFLALLGRLLRHEHAAIRAAAVRLLAGASGIPTWRRLVAALRDTDAQVRRVAVDALHESARSDPPRWVHACLHPAADVAQRAAELGPPGSVVTETPSGHHAPAPEVERIVRGEATDSGGVLETFLRWGTEADPALRLQAAAALGRLGHYELVLPIFLAADPPALNTADVRHGYGGEQMDLVARGIVALGSADHENMVADVLSNRGLFDEDEKALVTLVTEASDVGVRQWARDQLPIAPLHDRRLIALARAFAWGVELGPFLTGEKFRIEMPHSEQDLGYTRLRHNVLYISPRPILLQERYGPSVVRGLILHEYGHHLYHKGPAADAVWKQAEDEGLARLLNLVSDEHLERNLRQRSRLYGDLLKLLNVHAFQYAVREVPVAALLAHLAGREAEVLPRIPLGAARKAGHVAVHSGRVLRELEGAGLSFVRFMRALRLGLGNRHGDPKVAQALALFRGGFRKADMPRLLEITRKLREIFGQETDLLNSLGPDTGLGMDELDRQAGTCRVTPEGLQSAVDSALQRRDRKRAGSGGPAGQGMNLGPGDDFYKITRIEKVPHDPARHAEYAKRVAPPARRLRRYFEDLGLGMVAQRFRVQGRLLDRGRLRDLIFKADPRLLIARQRQRVCDLFVGIVVDCSGSMAGERMEKARLFATLLAEGLRGLPGVELRIFGFEHDVIYDAGDARRCAAHDLKAGAGNNDAAALWHAAQVARAARRKSKLLVMISDGLPTECTVAALRGLVARLTRQGYCCAQVAVEPISEVCFPHYVVLRDQLDQSVQQFGSVVQRLVRQALGVP